MFIGGGGIAPNGSRVYNTSAIAEHTAALVPAAMTLNRDIMREYGAALSSYSNPVVGIGGSAPPGLGFSFGDSWKRTQRGVMEFSQPSGQVDVMNHALRYCFENLFMAKGLRLRTQFTCTGLKNVTPSDMANDFFDTVVSELFLQNIYRKASWLYDSIGLVPILLPPEGQPMTYVEILDPRMVRVETYFGKTFMWLVVDKRMTDALNDPNGTQNPRNKAYWDSLPKHWKEQLISGQKQGLGEKLITLQEGEFICLENRLNPIERGIRSYDGCPIQPYFAALEEYRMHMAGDFATAFLAKNIIALVSVGDPKAEGDNYVRPDDNTNLMMQSVLQNPNQAQYVFGDPTMNIRYIVPDPNSWTEAKYANCKEQLKNFLPSPFWFNEGQGSFAAATVEVQALQEEIKYKNSDFDRNFWLPIYNRAAAGRARIGKKVIKAPNHDENAMMDQMALAQKNSTLYANGGLDIRSLIESHGFDFDVVKQRLTDQTKDAKDGVFMPAFEQKQGIVAKETYGIGDEPQPSSDGGKGGGQKKVGSPSQSESKQGRRTPRPGGK